MSSAGQDIVNDIAFHVAPENDEVFEVQSSHRQDDTPPCGSEYVVAHSHPVRVAWDVMIALLIVYLSFALPFIFAFYEETDITDEWDWAMDIIFMLDIPLNFFTSYTNKEGIAIVDMCAIAKHYMKFWFWVDLISSVPIDRIVSSQIARFSKLVKILRMIKFVKLMRASKLAKLIPVFQSELGIRNATLSILKFLGLIFTAAHWLGCCFFLLARLQDFGDDTWVVGYLGNGGYDDAAFSAGSKYVASLYWALTTMSTIGYGDITPGTDYERLFVAFSMCLGAGIFGYGMTNMCTLVFNFNLREVRFTALQDDMRTYLDRHHVSDALKDRIKAFLFFRQFRSSVDMFDETDLLQHLSPNLQREVRIQFLEKLFLHVPLLHGLTFRQGRDDIFISQIASKVKGHSYPAGEVILRQGQHVNEIRMLSLGGVLVTCFMEMKDEWQDKLFIDNNMDDSVQLFGYTKDDIKLQSHEIELIEDRKRDREKSVHRSKSTRLPDGTVIAPAQGDVGEDADFIGEEFQLRRKLSSRKSILSPRSPSGLLSPMNSKDDDNTPHRRYTMPVKQVTLHSNKSDFEESDSTKEEYVFPVTPLRAKVVIELFEGASFGEVSCILQARSRMDVVAVSHCDIYSLSYDDLATILSEYAFSGTDHAPMAIAEFRVLDFWERYGRDFTIPIHEDMDELVVQAFYVDEFGEELEEQDETSDVKVESSGSRYHPVLRMDTFRMSQLERQVAGDATALGAKPSSRTRISRTDSRLSIKSNSSVEMTRMSSSQNGRIQLPVTTNKEGNDTDDTSNTTDKSRHKHSLSWFGNLFYKHKDTDENDAIVLDPDTVDTAANEHALGVEEGASNIFNATKQSPILEKLLAKLHDKKETTIFDRVKKCVRVEKVGGDLHQLESKKDGHSLGHEMMEIYTPNGIATVQLIGNETSSSKNIQTLVHAVGNSEEKQDSKTRAKRRSTLAIVEEDQNESKVDNEFHNAQQQNKNKLNKKKKRQRQLREQRLKESLERLNQVQNEMRALKSLVIKTNQLLQEKKSAPVDSVTAESLSEEAHSTPPTVVPPTSALLEVESKSSTATPQHQSEQEAEIPEPEQPVPVPKITSSSTSSTHSAPSPSPSSQSQSLSQANGAQNHNLMNVKHI